MAMLWDFAVWTSWDQQIEDEDARREKRSRFGVLEEKARRDQAAGRSTLL
jgi:hypothetical protein